MQESLKDIRDVHYEFNEDVLTGDEKGTPETYQTLTGQLTGSPEKALETPKKFRTKIEGIAPVPQEPGDK